MNLEHIAFTTTDLATQEGYYIDNSPNASNRILKSYKGVNYNARHQVGYLMSYFPIAVLRQNEIDAVVKPIISISNSKETKKLRSNIHFGISKFSRNLTILK